MTEASGGRFVPIRSRTDLDRFLALRAGDANVVGGMLAIEGAHALDGDVENLTRLFDAGIRQHLHEVPVLVVPCIEGRFETAGVCLQATLYGSILPAVWSFMLALRARGIGACWTTDHLFYEHEAAQILGIPDTVTQVALLPVAYFSGADFKPAQRLPARERTHWNKWGACG